MDDKKQNTSLESYKGVRDFYPEDMAVQNYIFSVWKKVAQEALYAEYSASILEYADLYRSKGSDEIVNEQMYLFTDKGDREVALRPEMTPSLARMVAARRKGLKLPLRWFSIPNVFRYERPQRGRKREHWQLNCDIMGISGVEAEVEIIELAYKIMKKFGARDEDFVIKIGSKELQNFIMDIFGFDEIMSAKVLKLTDKKTKIENEYYGELRQIFGNRNPIQSCDRYIELLMTKDTDSFFNALPKEANIYRQKIEKVIDGLKKCGIKNVSFDRFIVRGFDYYTGIVFEVFDTNEENKRSLFGGGRYDNLLEMFGVEPLPTVGFGMGDVTIRDFLETHNLPLK